MRRSTINFFKKKRSANIELNFLMSIFVAFFILLLILSILKILSFTVFFDEFVQDEIRIKQLKRQLFIADDFKIKNDILYFRYKKKDCVLEIKNNHLIFSPGTIIILENVDNVSFYENKENYYMKYCRKKRCENIVIYEK